MLLSVSWKQRSLLAGRLLRPGLSRGSSYAETRRSLLTVAIETSCDDTSVAVLEKHTLCNGKPCAKLHFHEKITADNSQFKGIHPLHSLESHQAELPGLLSRALRHLPRCQNASANGNKSLMLPGPNGALQPYQKPDFITATRGPGARSSLSAGLDLAKGLCLAWDLPLMGAHHMQAHALTPRLVGALKAWEAAPEEVIKDIPTTATNGTQTEPTLQTEPAPSFPFLSLLVSGGHTLLLHSTSLTEHTALASTSDIAIGDAIDKLARCVLPPALLAAARDTNYGRLLERFTFPPPTSGSYNYEYAPPPRRHEEIKRYISPYGWSLVPPLADSRIMEFSFSGLDTKVRNIVTTRLAEGGMDDTERRHLAREAMRIAFEHCAGRVVLALNALEAPVQMLVLSGGVASNLYLRHLMRAFLDVRGYGDVRLEFPPVELCTDNAAMIAWAGVEMWEAGWRSDLACLPEKRWPLGDIMGVGGWVKR